MERISLIELLQVLMCGNQKRDQEEATCALNTIVLHVGRAGQAVYLATTYHVVHIICVECGLDSW